MIILRNIEYDPMNDVLFKHIFGEEERKHITIGFLNAVLNREGKNPIKDIEFRNVEFVPQREDEKLSEDEGEGIVPVVAEIAKEVGAVSFFFAIIPNQKHIVKFRQKRIEEFLRGNKGKGTDVLDFCQLGVE